MADRLGLKGRLRFVVVLLGLLCARLGHAANFPAGTTQTLVTEQDFYEGERQRLQAKEIQERYRLTVPIQAVPKEQPAPAPTPELVINTSTEESGVGSRFLWLSALLAAVGYLALRRLAPDPDKSLFAWLNPLQLLPGYETRRPPTADFFITVKSRPATIAQRASLASPSLDPKAARQQERPGERTELILTQPSLILTPERLLTMRSLLDEMSGPAGGSRQKALSELCRKVRDLKDQGGLRDFVPAWQLASILEQLLAQLETQPAKAAPSVLRTVSAGVDVLGTLSRPGLRSNFWTDSPPRLLAVDDNSLCRHALNFGLKKAFNQADVSPTGESALSLASQHRYDAIFLDVLMPGMDGLELCSKIHQTTLNRTTPVVFVTADEGFNAGDKAIICGGTDSLAKPFLTFELALKALSLVLGSRLGAKTVASPVLAAK